LFGVEGLQVIRLLAVVDEFDGQAKFFLERYATPSEANHSSLIVSIVRNEEESTA
jgi:hypothetical protein